MTDELEAAIALRFEGGWGGGGFTIKETVAACDKLPLVPVIVRVLEPFGVEPAVVTVSVEEPDPLIDVGLKLAVVLAGRPLALRPTVPVKPFCGAIVTV